MKIGKCEIRPGSKLEDLELDIMPNSPESYYTRGAVREANSILTTTKK